MTNNELQKRIDLLENRIKKLEESQEPPHYEFKVGDRVRFKSWEEIKNKQIDQYCIAGDLLDGLSGVYATINNIKNGKSGKIYIKLKDFSSTKGNKNIVENLSYNPDMLKPAPDKPKCKFKVGDKVIIAEKSDTHNGDIAMILSQPKTDNDWYKVGFDNGNWTLCPEWTLEPYTEPRWTFTDDEKVILRNLPEKYKWIARDKNGVIAVYYNPPSKTKDYWETNDMCFELLIPLQHLFQSIKWTDEQPCEFRKYL